LAILAVIGHEQDSENFDRRRPSKLGRDWGRDTVKTLTQKDVEGIVCLESKVDEENRQ
jgi:hypothetical protein